MCAVEFREAANLRLHGVLRLRTLAELVRYAQDDLVFLFINYCG